MNNGPIFWLITITIDSPLDNATINRADTLVRGTVTNVTGNETGVTVNGIVAVVYNGEFFVNHVPLEDGQNTITANAIDTAGNSASHSILVTADTTQPHVTLNANIESGIAPLTTYFSVSTSIPNSVTFYDFDYEGDATVDYTGSTFDDVSVTYNGEGIVYPTVTVTDDQSVAYPDTIAIVVLNQNDLDALLQAKWSAMKTALSNHDITGALSQFHEESKNQYSQAFNYLFDYLPDIVNNMQNIELIYVKSNYAKYRIRRIQVIEGTTEEITYYIYFVKGSNGIWVIENF